MSAVEAKQGAPGPSGRVGRTLGERRRRNDDGGGISRTGHRLEQRVHLVNGGGGWPALVPKVGLGIGGRVRGGAGATAGEGTRVGDGGAAAVGATQGKT